MRTITGWGPGPAGISRSARWARWGPEREGGPRLGKARVRRARATCALRTLRQCRLGSGLDALSECRRILDCGLHCKAHYDLAEAMAFERVVNRDLRLCVAHLLEVIAPGGNGDHVLRPLGPTDL